MSAIWLLLKESRAAQLAILVAVVALATFIIAKCTGGNSKEAAQAKQTTMSGEAIANAAHDAVSTVSNRSEADLAIDAATAQAKKEIGNAANPADVRAAVLRGLCQRADYRLDPACVVQSPAP